VTFPGSGQNSLNTKTQCLLASNAKMRLIHYEFFTSKLNALLWRLTGCFQMAKCVRFGKNASLLPRCLVSNAKLRLIQQKPKSKTQHVALASRCLFPNGKACAIRENCFLGVSFLVFKCQNAPDPPANFPVVGPNCH